MGEAEEDPPLLVIAGERLLRRILSSFPWLDKDEKARVEKEVQALWYPLREGGSFAGILIAGIVLVIGAPIAVIFGLLSDFKLDMGFSGFLTVAGTNLLAMITVSLLLATGSISWLVSETIIILVEAAKNARIRLGLQKDHPLKPSLRNNNVFMAMVYFAPILLLACLEIYMIRQIPYIGKPAIALFLQRDNE